MSITVEFLLIFGSNFGGLNLVVNHFSFNYFIKVFKLILLPTMYESNLC